VVGDVQRPAWDVLDRQVVEGDVERFDEADGGVERA
jgi:hypothetical protein